MNRLLLVAMLAVAMMLHHCLVHSSMVEHILLAYYGEHLVQISLLRGESG